MDGQDAAEATATEAFDVVSCLPPTGEEPPQGAWLKDAGGHTEDSGDAHKGGVPAMVEGARNVSKNSSVVAEGEKRRSGASILVARIAARRLQLAAEPVPSSDSVNTIEETAAALAELRGLLAAAAAEELQEIHGCTEDSRDPKVLRTEKTDDAQREADRVELTKQLKRLMKWNLTAPVDAPWDANILNEEVFCALVCALALVRGQVRPLESPTEDKLKRLEASHQVFGELLTNSDVSFEAWEAKVAELVAVAWPRDREGSAAHPSTAAAVQTLPKIGSHNNDLAIKESTPHPQHGSDPQPAVRLLESPIPITTQSFGFTHEEVQTIMTAIDISVRDLVPLQLYMFKNNLRSGEAAAALQIKLQNIGFRDPFRIGRLLERFRTDRSFEPVSSVHPSMPKSWDVTCRLVGFVHVRVRQDNDFVEGVVCVITDLRGRPLYSGNIIRRTERESWEAALKEIHSSYWFTPKKAQFLVGPPTLQGAVRMMCVRPADSPQAQQQNAMIARLLKPVAELIDHIETFSILQKGTAGIDNMNILGIVRFLAFCHGVTKDNPHQLVSH